MDTASAMSNTNTKPPIHPFFKQRRPNYLPPPNAGPTNTAPTVAKKPLPQADTPHRAIQPSIQSASTLPQGASICDIQKEHVDPLRRINSLLLPISYPDSFYRRILTADEPISFSKAILWKDSATSEPKVVGGIVCRVDPALAPESTPQAVIFLPGLYDIYIQSLALLLPYRGLGLVASALDRVIEAATNQQDIKIVSLYAHVWTKNEEALQWYSARGFKQEDPVIQGYYRRLKPDTAWIFRRRLLPSDHLQRKLAAEVQLEPYQSQPISPKQPRTSTSDTPVPDRPDAPNQARSFQTRGPEREWNDLPDEVITGSSLKPPSNSAPKVGSATSSRSSSRSGVEKGRKKRVYPTATYGSS